jgi:hypothetical protein
MCGWVDDGWMVITMKMMTIIILQKNNMKIITYKHDDDNYIRTR